MSVCLIVIAGCGSSRTTQFKAGYAAAQAPLNQTFLDVSRTVTHVKGETLAEIARSFGALADRLGEELAPLEALKPPAVAATAFTKLCTSLDRVERDLRGTSVALRAKDLVAAAHALEHLRSDAVTAADAATGVAQKLDHK
ncbi:MAG TPA: hypothetical protein VIJ20_03935 [Solirubrobacteraceae bacterium]